MTRRRWIADEVDGNSAALTGENARHLARVLRACKGQQFDIVCGNEVREGTIVTVSYGRVEFELGQRVDEAGKSRRIRLLLSVFKFDRMEWAIEKATELGVDEITPVIARRTDAHLADSAMKRVERWRKIAREAAQQSRRADVPKIVDPIKLKQALAAESGMDWRIVLSEEERVLSLRDVLQNAAADSAVVLAIGPEGGWTPDELKLFAEYGWNAASLGATVLRAETAAIATIAIAASILKQSQ